MTQTFNVGARSRFVTFTAWLFMALGLLATVFALVHSASVAAMPPAPADAPWQIGWLQDYLPWLAAVGVLLSVAMLASACGLWLRLEWARRVFIALMLVAIVVNLGGLWLQQAYMLSVVDATLHTGLLSPKVAQVFGGFVIAARTLATGLTLAGCVALAVIAWRLTAPAIRQEFA